MAAFLAPALGHAYDLRCSEYSYSGVAPTFLVGADLHFPRFSKYMNAQVELSYTPHRYTASDVTQEGSHPKLTTNELAGRIGISYVFCPEARIKPFLQGGLNISLHTGMKEENVSYKYRIDSNTEVINRVGTMDHGKATKLGIYLGGGIDISHIRISAMWRKAMGGGAIEKGCGILLAGIIVETALGLHILGSREFVLHHHISMLVSLFASMVKVSDLRQVKIVS